MMSRPVLASTMVVGGASWAPVGGGLTGVHTVAAAAAPADRTPTPSIDTSSVPTVSHRRRPRVEIIGALPSLRAAVGVLVEWGPGCGPGGWTCEAGLGLRERAHRCRPGGLAGQPPSVGTH